MQRYINFFTLLCCLAFISGCASYADPARSLADLDAQSQLDKKHGGVITLDVNKSFKATVKQVAKQMDRCLVSSYTSYDRGGKVAQQTTYLKSKKLGTGKVRLFIETENIDYGLFGDKKSIYYAFMVDIQKLSAKKTRVTSKRLNNSSIAGVVIGKLRGDSNVPCPTRKNIPEGWD